MKSITFRKGRNGVPILSKQEIDRLAESILSDFKPELLTAPVATPIEEFIELYLNLSLDYAYLSRDKSILGLITFSNGSLKVYDDSLRPMSIAVREGTVLVDNSLLEVEQTGRCRFTLGHESGHWIFHKHRFQRDDDLPFACVSEAPASVSFRCQSKNMGRISQYNYFQTDEEWMEWQADSFSSAFLMPQSTFRQAADRLLMKLGISAEDMRYDEYGTENSKLGLIIEELAHIYDVSNQAAAVRLCKLGYLPQDQLTQLFSVI